MMRRKTSGAGRLCPILLTALLAGGQAFAQQPLKGIGFAYAPGQGMAACLGDSPEEALQCARQACVRQSGVYPSECLRVAWCYPAGWSVAIAFLGQELHWSQYSCGWPSQEAAIKGGEVICAAQDEDQNIQECIVSAVWDPQGREIAL